jgi:hypothetical protein
MTSHRSQHLNGYLLLRYSIYLADSGEPDFDGRRLTQAEVML